jgi:hypothetical protein
LPDASGKSKALLRKCQTTALTGSKSGSIPDRGLPQVGYSLSIQAIMRHLGFVIRRNFLDGLWYAIEVTDSPYFQRFTAPTGEEVRALVDEHRSQHPLKPDPWELPKQTSERKTA